MQNWVQTLTDLGNLCLSSDCPLCQRSTTRLICSGCERQLQRLQLPHPEQFWQPPLPVLAWGIYSGGLKHLIAALKYQKRTQLAYPLGSRLAQTWRESQIAKRSLVVVPIPMHPDKQRQRGFNQAALLAQAFCRQTGLPLKQRGLSRSRSTEAQFGLSATAREQNLAGAFELGTDFLHQPPKTAVLLLDDIYTTGATTRAAADILRRHQISVYGVITVAKALSESEQHQISLR
jgi:ComF family protein